MKDVISHRERRVVLAEALLLDFETHRRQRSGQAKADLRRFLHTEQGDEMD